MSCPSPEELASLLDDRLAAPRREDIESHLESCPGCRERLIRTMGETSVPVDPPHADPARGDAEPTPSFLGRLREVMRREVGSTPSPGLWSIDAAESEPAPVLPAIPGIEIHHELGRGGLATVYRGRQIGLDRVVALKMIWLGRRSTQDRVVRMGNGPRTIAGLVHPNIIQVFQVGKQGDWLFAVFEYLEGGDLKSRLLREGPWPPARAASLMSTVAEAVHFIHGRGIVHRDLKSANILLTGRGEPKVADFGLSMPLGASDPVLNGSSSILGTPSYMSPEQASGKSTATGPASDIYSLGVVLYELLTGRLPFQGSNRQELLERVIGEVPAPPSSHRAGIPRVLDEICLRCLQKDPRDRYPEARRLAEDLERFVGRERVPRDLYSRARRLLAADHSDCIRKAREAEEANLRAEGLLRDAERSLYLGRIANAERAWSQGDIRAAATILQECKPVPGRPDQRDMRWSELWDLCRTRYPELTDGVPPPAHSET